MSNVTVYLSGSIRKGSEDVRSEDYYWSERHENEISRQFTDAGDNIKLLNPAKSIIDRADYYDNFGCDLHLVNISDFILCDFRKKKGIGIGAEMMFAVERGIPVISWVPEDSVYIKKEISDLFGQDVNNWMHPFIYGLSDSIIKSLKDLYPAYRELKKVNQNKCNEAIGSFLKKNIGKIYYK